MIVPAPDAELVARFRVDLVALTGAAPGRIGVAVSGGPDSLALLLLANAAFPDAVAAATVDHRLRPEAADEAAFVAGVSARLGVPHRTLTAEAAPVGNVQSAARALRYRLLGQWASDEGMDWLLTAHHADDQAETLLMRLLRGAGLSGLAGVRAAPRIGDLAVARPLLGWRRAELAGVVAAAGLTAIDDPSNADPRYDRVRLRDRLRDADWIEPPSLARSAAALAEASEALDWTTTRLFAERVSETREGLALDAAGLPDELQRRLVLDVIARLAPDAAPRGPDVQRLLATLRTGGIATLAGVKCVGGPLWRFELAPPRR